MKRILSTIIVKTYETIVTPYSATRYVVLRGLMMGLLSMSLASLAQNPKYEMRGVWVTTVYNLDWPESRFDSPATQQADLAFLFDELARTGINTVFFQVRSEADAMYPSALEPWSQFLTGTQGRTPSPYWDPLAVAIDLAHERGMELHAWLNPFRAISDVGSFNLAGNHITKTHPEWILETSYKGSDDNKIGSILSIINPGIPQAREHIVHVVEDIVRRYDVDGIHFDDYFYPYPPYQIAMEDEETFNQFGFGYTSMGDWRRDNINAFIVEVNSAIENLKTGVRFGVSPFPIWKDQVPPGISGLDAFNVIFSDPVNWLLVESVDYLVPLLYWKIGGAQDHEKLAEWWVDQANGIHIYPGIAAYKADMAFANGGAPEFDGFEIPAQLSLGRVMDGIQGSVFFRADNLGRAQNQGLTQALISDFYGTKAFTPYMLYKDTWPPDASTSLTAVSGSNGVALRWDPPLGGFSVANKWGVYRMRSDASTPDARDMTNDVKNLIAISWDPDYVDDEALEVGGTYYYAVTGLSANSIEGAETNFATVSITSTGKEAFPSTTALRDISVYPNPVSQRATIILELGESVDIDVRVLDMLGHEVARPPGGSGMRSPGKLELTWDLMTISGRGAAAGVYQIVVRTGSMRAVKSVVVLP